MIPFEFEKLFERLAEKFKGKRQNTLGTEIVFSYFQFSFDTPLDLGKNSG